MSCYGRLLSTCVLLALSSAAAQAGDAPSYVSGGVGEDSAAEIARLSSNYNFKLLFATKDGHYVADVAVQIKATPGNTVLSATSEGPFLLANLSPGKYEISVTYAGLTQTRSTTVPPKGTRELVFRWQEETEKDVLNGAQ